MAYEAFWTHGSTAVAMFPGGAGPEGTNGHRLKQVSAPVSATESANIPWSDLFGFRGHHGATFRGVGNGDTNVFTFSIPTPSYRSGTITGPWNAPRAQLNNVCILYAVDPGVEIFGIRITDGARRFENFINEFGRIGFLPGFSLPAGNRTLSDPSLTIEQLQAGLVEGTTNFTIRDSRTGLAPTVMFAIGIEISVRFNREGNVGFAAVGAGFIVQDS